jgi:hypothetical protein
VVCVLGGSSRGGSGSSRWRHSHRMNAQPTAPIQGDCLVVEQSSVHTLNVVKKNSPGDSCRNRTPASATGASRNNTRSLEKAKHVPIAAPPASSATSTRSRSSSRWSQMGSCRDGVGERITRGLICASVGNQTQHIHAGSRRYGSAILCTALHRCNVQKHCHYYH